MASVIPEITISDFKKLKVEQLRRLKCCEVFADGEYLFTFTNAATDFVRLQAEYNGQLSNSVKGEALEQILKQE